MKRAIFTLATAFLLGSVVVGCGESEKFFGPGEIDDPNPGPTGSLTIVTSTIGSYQVVGVEQYGCRIDGEDGGLGVALNETHAHTLLAGSHVVELTGVPENCAVQGGSSRIVEVVEGEDVQVGFEITCW